MTTQQSSATRISAVLALASLISTGCASTPKSSDTVHDPWEGFNRSIFAFNEGADKWVIEPVAKGWDFVFPDPVEEALARLFENSKFPVRFLNDILQAKPLAAAEDLGRFVINSTIGIGGLFDPASAWGLENHKEDFGQTLGYWGVPPGPYLVLPLIGPSNPRDAVGMAADSAARVYPFFAVFWISSAITATDLLNSRSLNLDTIAAERKSALDFYVFQRNAYMQYRENLIHDREDESENKDDLYYPEDDDESAVEPGEET